MIKQNKNTFLNRCTDCDETGSCVSYIEVDNLYISFRSEMQRFQNVFVPNTHFLVQKCNTVHHTVLDIYTTQMTPDKYERMHTFSELPSREFISTVSCISESI
jgi:hypothetical protein